MIRPLLIFIGLLLQMNFGQSQSQQETSEAQDDWLSLLEMWAPKQETPSGWNCGASDQGLFRCAVNVCVCACRLTCIDTCIDTCVDTCVCICVDTCVCICLYSHIQQNMFFLAHMNMCTRPLTIFVHVHVLYVCMYIIQINRHIHYIPTAGCAHILLLVHKYQTNTFCSNSMPQECVRMFIYHIVVQRCASMPAFLPTSTKPTYAYGFIYFSSQQSTLQHHVFGIYNLVALL